MNTLKATILDGLRQRLKQLSSQLSLWRAIGVWMLIKQIERAPEGEAELKAYLEERDEQAPGWLIGLVFFLSKETISTCRRQFGLALPVGMFN